MSSSYVPVQFYWISLTRSKYSAQDCRLYVSIFVSVTKKKKDIKIPLCVSVDPRAKKFDTVSNDHGLKHKCNFSVSDQRYTFS